MSLLTVREAGQNIQGVQLPIYNTEGSIAESSLYSSIDDVKYFSMFGESSYLVFSKVSNLVNKDRSHLIHFRSKTYNNEPRREFDYSLVVEVINFIALFINDGIVMLDEAINALQEQLSRGAKIPFDLETKDMYDLNQQYSRDIEEEKAIPRGIKVNELCPDCGYDEVVKADNWHRSIDEGADEVLNCAYCKLSRKGRVTFLDAQ